MRTFGYGLKQGFKNVVQNKIFSLAAIGTIATCLFLLGLFYVLLSNFRNIMYNAESNMGITAFFDKDIEPERIDKLAEQIRARDEVEEVRYISPQEAWESFQKEMYGESDQLQNTFGSDNPLKDSASFEIYLKDVSAQTTITDYVQSLEGIRKVNGSSAVAKGLSSINMLVAYISVTIIILLLMVSIFLINTSVATGIRVRSDEIAIIKMIGATDAFVRAPFLVEGVVLGLVGAAIPIGIIVLSYERLIHFVLNHFSALSQWLTFIDSYQEMIVLVPVLLLIGVGIGLVGSAVSVRRHLQR
ncbi:MAG: permease-like cell division protein FtsX [Lachnospiraceae bacterium]|nr:permease-like cell division protein FtsX [Lachnospiraceae bacterium]